MKTIRFIIVIYDCMTLSYILLSSESINTSKKKFILNSVYCFEPILWTTFMTIWIIGDDQVDLLWEI